MKTVCADCKFYVACLQKWGVEEHKTKDAERCSNFKFKENK